MIKQKIKNQINIYNYNRINCNKSYKKKEFRSKDLLIN